MRALVLGFYGHSNLGDQAMQPAIRSVLGPDADVTFTDNVQSLEGYDALLVGGGSFLDNPLCITLDPHDLHVPLIFIGVGIHAYVHPNNEPWLERADLIVARNNVEVDGILVGPDLLYAREDLGVTSPPEERVLTLILNGYALGSPHSPTWVRDSWRRFEVALAEVVDRRFASWNVSLVPMCAEERCHSHHDDRLPATRLLGLLPHTDHVTVEMQPLSEEGFVDHLSRSSLILSHRLHGAIFSAVLGRRFVGISSHDKMRSYFLDAGMSNIVDYYQFSDTELGRAIQHTPPRDVLDRLRVEGRERWAELSATIRSVLGLPT